MNFNNENGEKELEQELGQIQDTYISIQEVEPPKNGCINIKSVPVKKSWFKKLAPYIACTLVSAFAGGIAGGAFMNYMIGKNTYISPISSSVSQNNSTSPIVYNPSNSLIARIAEEVGPAIVGIETKGVTQGFFGSQQVAQGSGSGIIFDAKGYIVTNQHVIDGSKDITVNLPGGESVKAQVIGSDPTSDLAVLKINADNLPVAKFGDSTSLRVGDLAVAIGNPMGEEYAGSVTSGIISALNRSMNINDGDYSRRYKLIQTDAAINPGNSGGALINERGEVIGINTIKYVDSDVEGMGFAIPINEAKPIIEQLMKNGYVSRPQMGVSVVTIDSEMAKEYKCPEGVGIQTVTAGGAAEAAGLKPGDVILQIDGVTVTKSEGLVNEIQQHKVGDPITLKIWREGSTLTINATLGEQSKQTS